MRGVSSATPMDSPNPPQQEALAQDMLFTGSLSERLHDAGLACSSTTQPACLNAVRQPLEESSSVLMSAVTLDASI